MATSKEAKRKTGSVRAETKKRVISAARESGEQLFWGHYVQQVPIGMDPRAAALWVVEQMEANPVYGTAKLNSTMPEWK